MRRRFFSSSSKPLSPALSPLGRGEGVGGSVELRPFRVDRVAIPKQAPRSHQSRRFLICPTRLSRHKGLKAASAFAVVDLLGTCRKKVLTVVL